MASKVTLQVELDADSSGLLREFKRVEASTRKMESGFSRTAKTATTLAASFISLSAVKDVGVSVISTAAKFETLNTSLGTVFKSQERGAEKFKELTKFASETPFAIDEVTQATIKMKALGLDPSTASLRSMGNTASAMGKTLMQFTEAMADAIVGEFERLKEFGIKSKSVGKDVEFTFQGVTTKVGKNAGEIEAYLRSIGDVEFAGSMERQSKTLVGAFSNLRGSVDLLANTVAQESGLASFTKGWVRDLTFIINDLMDVEESIDSINVQIQELKNQGPTSLPTFAGDAGDAVEGERLAKIQELENRILEIKKNRIAETEKAEKEADAAVLERLRLQEEEKARVKDEALMIEQEKASEKLATDFEALDEKYQTEREMLDRKLNEELALIESAQAEGLTTEENGQALKQKVREKWAKKLLKDEQKRIKEEEALKKKNFHDTLKGAASFFGSMADQSKGFAIAEAVTNTWLGVSQSLAAYPMPAAALFAAAHLVQGLKAVNNIKSGNKSGTIDSGPSSAPEIADIAGADGLGAANDSGAIKTIRLDVEGLGDDAVFNKAFLRNLTDQINEESDSNVLIKVG